MALGIIERQNTHTSPLFFINQEGVKFLASQILSYHETLAMVEGIQNPYFDFAKGEGPFYKEATSRTGLRTRIGNISSFTKEEMACFLQNAIDNYKEKGTMGSFPRGNPGDESQIRAERELTKVFIEGFNSGKNWGVIMIDKKTSEGVTVILGGCLVSTGSLEKPLSELVGQSEATLSTLSCLSFDFTGNEKLGKTPEKTVVEVTRLFTISDSQSKVVNITDSERRILLPSLIESIDKAIDGLKEETKKPIQYGLADISDERLLNFVGRYGWSLITDKTNPTDLVKEGILRHHYVYFTKDGRKIYAISKNYQ